MIVVLVSHPANDLKEFAKSMAIKFSSSFMDVDETSLHKNSGIFHNPPNNNVVCSGYVLADRFKQNAVKIFIKYSDEFMTKYYMAKTGLSFDNAKQKCLEIFANKKDWLRNYFGIDINDLSQYDLVINADNLDNDGIVSVIEKYVSKVK